MNEADEALEQVATIVAVFTMCIAFVAGYVVSSYVNDSPVVEKYLAMQRDDRAALVLYLNSQNDIPAEASRAIAEDFCAETPATMRVCRNARKYVDPISGNPVAGIIEEK